MKQVLNDIVNYLNTLYDIPIVYEAANLSDENIIHAIRTLNNKCYLKLILITLTVNATKTLNKW